MIYLACCRLLAVLAALVLGMLLPLAGGCSLSSPRDALTTRVPPPLRMEYPVKAPCAGIIKAVKVNLGSFVEAGCVLLFLAPLDA